MAKAATKTKPETEVKEDVKDVPSTPPAPTETKEVAPVAAEPTEEASQQEDTFIPDEFKEGGEPSVARLLVNVNTVQIAGNVGNDPEIRYFDSGKVKATLSIAVRSSSNEPDWFKVELWDKQAEVAYNYAKKGSVIGIDGYLKIDTWQDKNTGATRSRPVIKCRHLSLLAKAPHQYAQQYGEGEAA